MKALILQHASFETPGYILNWLTDHQFSTEILKLYHKENSCPVSYEVDLLIIMGGPMSVHDEQIYPWMTMEKQLIKNIIDRNIPTLGVCLGAQLIADIYGASVKPAKNKEIGWFPIQVIQSDITKTLQWPGQFITYLWHGEQFDILENATLLAFSQGCPHQAFMMKKNVIGLQFHPEITLPMIETMIQNCFKQDHTHSPYVQSIEQMVSVPKTYYLQNHQIIDKILSYLTHQN